MSQVLYIGAQQNWYINGAPDSTLILNQGGEIHMNDIVLDTTSGIEYRVTAIGDFDVDTQTYINMAFKEVVDETNILSVLSEQGYEVNIPRSYANAGVGIGTPRTPSSTNDTLVIASISLNSTLLAPATVECQVDGNLVAEVSLSGLVATLVQTVTFIVPAGSAYQLATISGSASLVYLKELSL